LADHESIEDNPRMRFSYFAPYVDKETGKPIDGHYPWSEGNTDSGGPNDCFFAAALSQTSGMFNSITYVRTQIAAFVLSNPDFIIGILPAINIINTTRTPVRQKELMMEGGVFFNQNSLKEQFGTFQRRVQDLSKQNAEQLSMVMIG
jgi:hypothetical protein